MPLGSREMGDKLQTGNLRSHPVDLPDHQSLHEIRMLQLPDILKIE